MKIQTIGPVDAKIMLVAEFPHERDLSLGKPFIGGSGYELGKMCADAGMPLPTILATTVMRDAIPMRGVEALIAQKKKDITDKHVLFQGKYVLPRVVDDVMQLRKDIELYKPNVVCAMGNLALWALTGNWGITSWRSSILESTLVPGLKVIPTLPAMMAVQAQSKRPLIIHDMKRVVRHKDEPRVIRPDYKFIIRPDYSTAVSTLANLISMARMYREDHNGQRMRMGADIETRAGHIACIAFAWSSLEAICIPLMCTTKGKEAGYWTEEEEAYLVLLMIDLLREVKVIGQNWNYDAQYIYRFWHFLCPDVEDTMIQQHSCFSVFEKNLAFLSSMYLEDHEYWKDERTTWTEGEDGEGEDQYWIYNCKDSARTLAINAVLSQVIVSLGMQEVNAFQQKLAPVVLRTMNIGIRCDTSQRAGFALMLQEEAAKRQTWLNEVTGQELNIRSHVQMKDFFYRQMGQRVVTDRKTGSPTSNDEALRKIGQREPILLPITRTIAEMRSLGVFYGTFVQAPLDVDGRLRTSFNICGTETYRFSSTKNAFGSGLNMQNIPKGGETENEGEALDLPNVRKLFIPDAGQTFFDIDLDSADLRIVTWESDCKWMKEQFRLGNKPYIEVMKEYYRNPNMTKHSHPREYGMFKALCHGSNYLGTPDGLAPRIGLLVHETERIQKWYFDLCPEIRVWQEEIKKQVVKRKYVENAWGYRMYFLDRIEGTIFNQAVAWVPQATVGCLINRAYVNIDANLPHVRVLLQVHDSLAGQFPTALKDTAMKEIVAQATIPIPYEDPLWIPVGVATSDKSWGECG